MSQFLDHVLVLLLRFDDLSNQMALAGDGDSRLFEDGSKNQRVSEMGAALIFTEETPHAFHDFVVATAE